MGYFVFALLMKENIVSPDGEIIHLIQVWNGSFLTNITIRAVGDTLRAVKGY